MELMVKSRRDKSSSTEVDCTRGFLELASYSSVLAAAISIWISFKGINAV